MARFEEALSTVLEHEGWGAYTNDPADPGKATRWGISLKFLRRLGKVGDVDGDGDVDADDVRKLRKEQAISIYRQHWWEPLRLNELERQVVATKVFDLAVNMGQRPAVRILQYALHAVGQTHVIVDGIMGPQTLRAANAADPGRLLAVVQSAAAAYYEGLVQANPGLRKWHRGWIARALA